MVVMAPERPQVGILFQQYAERLHRLQRDRSTIGNFTKAARYLQTWMNEQGIAVEELEPTMVEEFFAGLRDARTGLDLAASTKRLYLVQIRAAFRYAHRRGVIRRDPTLDVQLARVPDTEPRILSNEQIRSLLRAAVTEPEHTMVALAAFTGMRRFELAKLTWESVDLQAATIRVVGKGGKYRTVPIHPALGELLADTRPEYIHFPVLLGPQGGHGVGMLVYRLALLSERSGVEVKFHDFRRTVASSLHHNGVDGDVIDKIMGWSPTNMRTKHYQRTADKRLHEAILALYRDEPVML